MSNPNKKSSKPKDKKADGNRRSTAQDESENTPMTSAQAMRMNPASAQQSDSLLEYPNRPESTFSALGIHSTRDFIEANLSEYDHLQMHDPFYPENPASNAPRSYNQYLTSDPHLSYPDRSSLQTPPNIGSRWYADQPTENNEAFNQSVRSTRSVSPAFEIPATGMYPDSPPATTPKPTPRSAENRAAGSSNRRISPKTDAPSRVKSNTSISKKRTTQPRLAKKKSETSLSKALDACNFEYAELDSITPTMTENPASQRDKPKKKKSKTNLAKAVDACDFEYAELDTITPTLTENPTSQHKKKKKKSETSLAMALDACKFEYAELDNITPTLVVENADLIRPALIRDPPTEHGKSRRTHWLTIQF